MNNFPLEITDQMKSVFQAAYKNKDVEAGISALKESGYSQMASAFVLMSEIGIDFTEANRVILNSKAWK